MQVASAKVGEVHGAQGPGWLNHPIFGSVLVSGNGAHPRLFPGKSRLREILFHLARSIRVYFLIFFLGEELLAVVLLFCIANAFAGRFESKVV